jgi:hypothetical protein
MGNEIAAARRVLSAGRWVAACMLAVPVGVMAASASASLHNFTIVVEDLDLDDGIEAGFSFSQTGQTEQSTFASARAIADGEVRSRQEFFTTFEAATLEIGLGDTTASAVAGNDFMTASGEGLDAQFRSGVSRRTSLEVAANTRLVFSGDASLTTDISSPSCAPHCEIAAAQVTIWSDATAGTTFSLTGLAHRFDPVDALTGHVSFSHSNTFGQTRSFGLQMLVEAQGAVGPIPEPQTYALMLAGLALCAGVARRRVLTARVSDHRR